MLRALYGMLIAALLWYKKLQKDLEGIGFEFNPYYPCVANRTKNDKQQTLRYHVDDVMSSHKDSEVNDDFYEWLDAKYGEFGEVTVTRGKRHEYLGMIFDFLKEGEVQIDMKEYMEDMIDECKYKIKEMDKAPTPMAAKGFEEDDSRKLNDKYCENFHMIVAKGLYACKRGRLDIHMAIAHLTR